MRDGARCVLGRQRHALRQLRIRADRGRGQRRQQRRLRPGTQLAGGEFGLLPQPGLDERLGEIEQGFGGGMISGRDTKELE